MKKTPWPSAYRIAAIPDIHTPFHDPDAIRVLCRYLASQRFDAIVQLGDLCDHESISRFVKEDPKRLASGDLVEEWRVAREVMGNIISAARRKNEDCRYFQLEGNHESRLQKFASQYPMLASLFDLKTHLQVFERGGVWVACDSEGEVLRFEVVGNKVVPIVRAPSDRVEALHHGVTLLHGLKFNTHHAMATAQLMPWMGPVVYGHTHQLQVHTTEKWGREKSSGYSAGWLGQVYPDYVINRPNRWEQGFAEIFIDPRMPGHTNVLLTRIVDGCLIASDGSVYNSRDDKR